MLTIHIMTEDKGAYKRTFLLEKKTTNKKNTKSVFLTNANKR